MTRLSWSNPADRLFETGLDRGVLYPQSDKRASYTSNVLGLGTKTFAFVLPMVKPYDIGHRLKIQQNPGSGYMIGTITASSSTSVTLTVTEFEGSGTVANWIITELDLAVAWNGLVSVSEDGSENAAAYYIDGRPFLFLPKPKEYSATLSAYTFPDAFSPMLGVAEATDGMYLDSQQGGMFDLCYRSLIGNSVDGTKFGYKIHLIYNATAVPGDVEYTTLTGDTDVNPFSFTLTAIPRAIDGYRPTAHITIDTRHMDSDKLATLEALIYGDESHNPQMPDPQTIFDILSFGDTIIITDNGDGTWEARGSYKNIYLIGDGVFQIDNVNAIDNGDGTYYISSTP